MCGIMAGKREEGGGGAVCLLQQDVRTLLAFLGAEDTAVVARID